MIAVIQRVKSAAVAVDGKTVGECGEGLYVLLGVSCGDTERDADALADKLVKLRIFTDENGKMNYSLIDIDGELLVVSNFTLLAAYRKGNRPDYMAAASPDEANRLYEYFVRLCREKVKKVGTGAFGEHMHTEMLTDGPVTIVMDSKVLLGPKKD